MYSGVSQGSNYDTARREIAKGRGTATEEQVPYEERKDLKDSALRFKNFDYAKSYRTTLSDAPEDIQKGKEMVYQYGGMYVSIAAYRNSEVDIGMSKPENDTSDYTA